jgi:hypothetical protein
MGDLVGIGCLERIGLCQNRPMRGWTETHEGDSKNGCSARAWSHIRRNSSLRTSSRQWELRTVYAFHRELRISGQLTVVVGIVSVLSVRCHSSVEREDRRPPYIKHPRLQLVPVLGFFE